jgi:hypothetical protein
MNKRAGWRTATGIVIGVSSGAAFSLKFGWIEAEVITEECLSQGNGWVGVGILGRNSKMKR